MEMLTEFAMVVGAMTAGGCLMALYRWWKALVAFERAGYHDAQDGEQDG